MTSLGQVFYNEAIQPARVMTAWFQRGDVASALNAVHYQNLANAFRMAVERVRRDTGVDRETIVLLLPESEMNAAALATASSQQRMVDVWNQHRSSLTAIIGRIVGAVVEVHLGIAGSGIGDALGAAGNQLVQDARLKGPFGELQTALGAYDQWLRWCVSILDNDVALNEAYRKRRVRRRFVSAVTWIGAIAVVGGSGYGIYWSALDHPSSPSPAMTTFAPESPLAGLVGTWTDTDGVTYEARDVGGAVAFHVVDASKMPRHGLQNGDVRFSISIRSNGAFVVEDHVQPVPPKGIEYDGTTSSCRELWSDVLTKPLLAHLDGQELVVDVVKLDASAAVFQVTAGKVVGCKALNTAPASRIQLTLSRR